MICETIFEHFHICEDAEITIEANPGTVEFKNYVHIGKMGSTGLVWIAVNSQRRVGVSGKNSYL